MRFGMTPPRMHTIGWSIGYWLLHISVNAGVGIGSISSATPTRSATMETQPLFQVSFKIAGGFATT